MDEDKSFVRANNPESSYWDVDAIVDQVGSSLDSRIPQSTVFTTVLSILEKYNDAAIRIYVPILVHREAVELLRKASSGEMTMSLYRLHERNF